VRPPRRRLAAISEPVFQRLGPDEAVAFPDLEGFRYQIARRPATAVLRAWSKLEETERRLAVFRWVVQVTDPNQPQHHTLLDDCESAFLMAFEATLGFVEDQFKAEGVRPVFGDWLKAHQVGRPEDQLLRGIRTLRHLEAHVRAELPHSLVVVVAERPRVKRQWQLPPLSEKHLSMLRSPRLDVSDLEAWNDSVRRHSAEELMARGLSELNMIVRDAESHRSAGPA
jgi:hypothetical protein